MKLKERPVLLQSDMIEQRDIAKIMAVPPIFDLKRARRAARIVNGMDGSSFAQYPALRVALTLALYNFDVANHPTSSQREDFVNGMRMLEWRERQAAQLQNPLPPIGWEVEVGAPALTNMKAAAGDGYTPRFYAFFDTINMDNFANPIYNDPRVVEFSPYPSYSADVAARLLSEMIKGGFIPSLRSSQKPEDRAKYLAEKLVSLHVNLGIPKYLDQEVDKNYSELGDTMVFASAFSLAFTSPLRLRSRAMTYFFDYKRGVEEMKETEKTDVQLGRIEVKALEVNSQKTYRLLHEMQLVGAALFASYSTKNPELAKLWDFYYLDRSMAMEFQVTQQTEGLLP